MSAVWLALLLPLAAAAGPLVSPELGMDQPAWGLAWRAQFSPSVAHDDQG